MLTSAGEHVETLYCSTLPGHLMEFSTVCPPGGKIKARTAALYASSCKELLSSIVGWES